MKKNKQKGYVLLLSVLISSIILAMSLGIFSIALKEVALATFARDSVKAFAAASRGLECAMFYDRINRHAAFSAGQAMNYYDSRDGAILEYTPFVRGSNNAFQVSPDGNSPGETWPYTNFSCSGISVSATANAINVNEGVSTFQLEFGDSCVDVEVHKLGIVTNFTSNGYSDKCDSTNPRRTQRTIAVTVNI